MRYDPRELRHISLKWKLLIPFLSLPVAMTILLTAWGINSQRQILNEQEERAMLRNYNSFRQRIDLQLVLDELLAELVALNPTAQVALAYRNRQALQQLYQPVFNRLQRLPGIRQFHFHEYPARSFLRLHRLDQFGEDLSGYRQTIVKAQEADAVVSALEFGDTGFSLRGVAPIHFQGRLVGSVEVGASLNTIFLNQIKTEFGCDLTVYVPAPEIPYSFRVSATTTPMRTLLAPEAYARAFEQGASQFLRIHRGEQSLAVLVGPLLGLGGQPLAVIELSRDRANTIELIRRYSVLITGFGLGLLILALAFVWKVSTLFLVPIDALAEQAEKITQGEQVPHVEVMARDEFGALAVALNKMLASLDQSRRQIEVYAHQLEDKVQERTAALVVSEEKFRTLVENIPLVVYRLEKDLVLSFVSPHLEKLTGWPAEEMVGHPSVWKKTIHPDDQARLILTLKQALEKDRNFELEYRLLDRQGQAVDVLDHGEPIKSEGGQISHIEGYLQDIRVRKHLAEQTVKAEELKTLTDISARLAHEFRNPLSVLGITARRLSAMFDRNDPKYRYSEILMTQVGRLEQVLNMILHFIKPVELISQSVLSRPFFQSLAEAAEPFLKEQQVELVMKLDDDLPALAIDPHNFHRALLNLVRNAAFQMPRRGILHFEVHHINRTLEIKLIYPAGYLPDDQLRHFFYPFTTEDADTSLVELPLTPVIVQKLGGIINVGREGDDLVAVTIKLPVSEESPASSP